MRYRPGKGTYGYESAVEDDGRIPAEVIGRTPTRVQIAFACPVAPGLRPRGIVRAVDAASLEAYAS